MASPPAPAPFAGSEIPPIAPVASASGTNVSSPPPPPTNESTTSSSSKTSPYCSLSSISVAGLIGVAIAAFRRKKENMIMMAREGVRSQIIEVTRFLPSLEKKKRRKRFDTGDYDGPPEDSDHGPDGRQQSGPSAGSDMMVRSSPGPFAGRTSLGNSTLTYEELATATVGFSKSNILGEGGFGCVYKGVLPGGQLVAVKKLKVGGQQGEKEFRAEVEIISRIHHRNLVSLVGYCIADNHRLLVYDYVPNGTLHYHLHRLKGLPVMDWPTRVKIASGVARGLAYLHEDCRPRIIHRDIKSSNILLDNNFEAQVSDFGLAKLTLDTDTHVTTRVMGTFGYLAPEYGSSGQLTEKSDVFSFGVLLLELVTGRKAVDRTQPVGEESVVEWVRPMLSQINSEKDLDLLADPSLNGVYDKKEMLSIIEAAAACIRHSATKRPRMGQVARALEGDASLGDLNKGINTGHSGVYNSSTCSDHDKSNYSSNIRRFRQLVFESSEYGSEYSGATSDFGVNLSASSSEVLR